MVIEKEFYQNLLKSSLSLSEREKIAESLLMVARNTNLDKWQFIESQNIKYRMPLSKIREMAYPTVFARSL